MTPNEITTLIAKNLDKELDVPFKLTIMARIDVWRSRHIRNTLEKDVSSRKFFTSTLYVPMETVNTTDCTVPYTQCKVSRSPKLPAPVRANGILFDYVGTIDGSRSFTYALKESQEFNEHNKYNKNIVSYEWENNRLKVSLPNIPKIKVIGIFDNPTKLLEFSCSGEGEDDCDFWNTEYPCTYEILQLCIQTVEQVDFKEKENIKLSVVTDTPITK